MNRIYENDYSTSDAQIPKIDRDYASTLSFRVDPLDDESSEEKQLAQNT